MGNYNGWSNWDTWKAKQLIDSTEPLEDALQADLPINAATLREVFRTYVSLAQARKEDLDLDAVNWVEIADAINEG